MLMVMFNFPNHSSVNRRFSGRYLLQYATRTSSFADGAHLVIAAAGRAQLPIAVVAAGGFFAGLVHLMIYPSADQVEEAHKCNTRQADANTIQAFTYTIQTLQSNKKEK